MNRMKRLERKGEDFLEQKKLEINITDNLKLIEEKITGLKYLTKNMQKRGKIVASDADDRIMCLDKLEEIKNALVDSFKTKERG